MHCLTPVPVSGSSRFLMRAGRILLSLCCLFTTAFSWTDMSGTYVGKGPNLAVMVQIAETSGGNFTGRYEQVPLKPGGQIEDMNATIAGTRSGETVVATLKTSDLFSIGVPLGDFFSVSVPLSGTYRGGVLHLSGGTNFVLNLTSGAESDFRTQVAALSTQGQQITDARAQREAARKQAELEADRDSKLQNLTGRLAAFITKADTMLPKFGPETQRYQAITERMRKGLARQRSIYGGPQASVARSQISVALNQLAIDANQIYLNDQQSYRDYDFNSGQLSREAGEAAAWCQRAIPVSLSSACPMFLDTQTQFAKRVSALRSAFADFGGVWTAERREQDAIVQASQHAQ
jgi:hypothetical protein